MSSDSHAATAVAEADTAANAAASQANPTTSKGLRLAVIPGTYGICRLDAGARIPRWVHRSPFFSITRTPEELSLICAVDHVPKTAHCVGGWRILRVMGTLDLSLIGVMASMAAPLADAGIGLMTMSTYDTDYLMVREKRLDDAIAALEQAGHRFEPLTAGDDTAAEPETKVEASEKAISEATSTVEDSEREATEAAVADAEEEAPIVEIVDVVSDDDADDDNAASHQEVKADEEPESIAALSRSARAKAAADELPADERAPRAEDERSGDDSEGLYTGAIPQHDVETIEDTFESIGISGPILDTITEIGFRNPTPIQAGVIPMALEGQDIIGLAETGSGKTAAFCLPLAERLTHGRGVRGLILCPTREIALQTKAFLDIFGRDHELDTVAIIGGVKMGPQIDALRRTPDILVATPGRLADHMRRRNVRMDKIEELVLDEADHMLDLGFLPQIQEILVQVPEERRTMMFSATMPKAIERLAQRFLNDPYTVDLRPVSRVAAGIKHRLYLVKDGDQKKTLVQLIDEVEGSTLVFSRRKLHTEWLARQLQLAGLPVERIHSDRTQAQRVHALRGFRAGECRVLVATDVAARGIDVPRLAHVINFGLPENVEDYVHRAGRTARGNAVGTVSSIGTWQDKVMVRQIESVIGQSIPRCTVEGVEPYREMKKKRSNMRRRRML